MENKDNINEIELEEHDFREVPNPVVEDKKEEKKTGTNMKSSVLCVTDRRALQGR